MAQPLMVATSTELPDSIDEGAVVAINSTLTLLDKLQTPCLRVEYNPDRKNFATPYQLIKETAEFQWRFFRGIANALLEAEEVLPSEHEKIRLIVPDWGWVAKLTKDWKLGTPDALLPNFVEVTAELEPGVDWEKDRMIIIIGSRLGAQVQKIWRDAKEVCPDMPIIFYNTDHSGRTVRTSSFMRMYTELVDLPVSFMLKIDEWGCVVRSFPRRFSLWLQDPRYVQQGGYRLIGTIQKNPTESEITKMVVKAIQEMKPEEEKGADLLRSFTTAINEVASGVAQLKEV